MSVAIHLEAKVSVSDTARRARPRPLRKLLTAVTRSDSCASRLAAALGTEAGHATSKQAIRAAEMTIRDAMGVDNRPFPPRDPRGTGHNSGTRRLTRCE